MTPPQIHLPLQRLLLQPRRQIHIQSLNPIHSLRIRNVVTSFKESAAKAVGLPFIEHDKRYQIADDYLRCLYKIWEGSWADDALKEDATKEIYIDFDSVRWIKHESENFKINAPHVLDSSPQRTPFLLQAGTSPAGIIFAATHAEAVLVSGLTPQVLAQRVAKLRKAAGALGRDPQSIKVLAVVTPIIGRTDEEAQEKYQRAWEYASFEGGLAFWSGNADIDLSKYELDTEITSEDVTVDGRVHSLFSNLQHHGDGFPKWTPRNIGKVISIGGNGPVPLGSPERVAGMLEEYLEVSGIDGFNVGYVISPGSLEDLSYLLVPELRRREVS